MEEKQIQAKEHWTLIVKPQTNWFDLHLGDVWRYRDLVMMFVKRDFVATYKQTILGPLWFLVQPILSTLLFFFVFFGIAHISTGGIPPVLFYLSGLTVWNYFATCFNKTSVTFTTNAALFGKVYFPRLTAPVATIFSTLITFGIQLLLFITILVFYVLFRGTEFHLSAYLLLIPLLLIFMGMLSLGSGIIISSMTSKYRDLANLVAFGVQLLMYASPVIYPLSMVSGKKLAFVMANPMTGIIESFRYAFFPRGDFNWNLLACSAAFSVIILFTGILLFNKTEKSFMDTV